MALLVHIRRVSEHMKLFWCYSLHPLIEQVSLVARIGDHLNSNEVHPVIVSSVRKLEEHILVSERIQSSQKYKTQRQRAGRHAEPAKLVSSFHETLTGLCNWLKLKVAVGQEAPDLCTMRRNIANAEASSQIKIGSSPLHVHIEAVLRQAKDKLTFLELKEARENLVFAIDAKQPMRLRGAISRALHVGGKESLASLMQQGALVLFELELETKSQARTSHSVLWEYSKGGDWAGFSIQATTLLEDAYQDGQGNPQNARTVEIEEGGIRYQIDVEAMQQRNIISGRVRAVRRIDASLPHQWLHTERKQLLVDVTNELGPILESILHKSSHRTTSEFPNSRCAAMADAKVEQVFQVQNFSRWNIYVSKVQALSQFHRLHGSVPTTSIIWLRLG